MPWRKTEPMEERLKLIADRLAGYSITELSVIYGVSRKTVYKWTERYNRLGHDGLQELCRAPINHPNQTDEEIIDHLVKAKQLHMSWASFISTLPQCGPSRETLVSATRASTRRDSGVSTKICTAGAARNAA